ncbi:hypothetical protein Barb7_00828 [Bacteroidales bacterium Barb7]|nr:hypothetical protein Barb7_00828 [Bacteroidales bacterium Barb7]
MITSYAGNEGIIDADLSRILIEGNVRIRGNKAVSGGAVAGTSTDLTIRGNVVIENNTAGYIGGGITVRNLSRVLIADNVQLLGNNAYMGGAIALSGSEVVIRDSVRIIGNTGTAIVVNGDLADAVASSSGLTTGRYVLICENTGEIAGAIFGRYPCTYDIHGLIRDNYDRSGTVRNVQVDEIAYPDFHVDISVYGGTTTFMPGVYSSFGDTHLSAVPSGNYGLPVWFSYHSNGIGEQVGVGLECDVKIWGENTQIVADFQKSTSLSVLYSAGGFVSGINPSGYYEFDVEVTLTATAYPGFVFKNWIYEGDTYSDTELSFIHNKPTMVRAVFERDPETVLPSPDSYILAIDHNEGGQVTTTHQGGWYEEKAVVQLTADPEEGHVFSYWSINGSRFYYEPVLVVYLNEDINVQAVFKEYQPLFVPEDKVFSLSTKAYHGTITGAKASYQQGDVVSLTAKADPNWHFSTWLLDGYPTGSETTFTFIIQGDVAVEALFETDGVPEAPKPQAYELHLTIEYDGDDLISSTEQHPAGTVVQLDAKNYKRRGYVFYGWSDGEGSLAGSSDEYEVTVSSNKIITAYFVKQDIASNEQVAVPKMKYANGELSVSGMEGCKVLVFNVSGSLVKELRVASAFERYPLLLPQGVYIVKAVKGGDSYAEKLIVRQ